MMETTQLIETQPLLREQGPTPLVFPLLDHVEHDFGVELGDLQFVSHNLFDLLVGKAHRVLLQKIQVHIRAQRRVGNRGRRTGDHRRPSSNMLFVDVLDELFQFELKLNVSNQWNRIWAGALPSQPCWSQNCGNQGWSQELPSRLSSSH